MASDHLSYYDPEEIDAAVCDLLDMNMLEDAEYLAEQGFRQHPNDDSVEKLVIWIYLHNHKVEKAEEMFKKYQDEESTWAVRMNFCFAVMHGHPMRSLKAFFDYLPSGEISPSDWVNTIDEMFEALPSDVLAPYLILATDVIDKDAESLGRIGGMLIDTHRYKEAAKAIEKSLDLDAYDIFSWQDLSRCYLLLQNFPKSLDACEYGLAIDEKNPLLGFIKGYIHYQNHEYKECIPYLVNARKFAEGQMDMRNLNMTDEEIQQQINVTYEMLGFAYMETEESEKSKECFEILVERNPCNPMAYLQLASIYLYEGNLNNANSYVRRAVQLDPKDESALSMQISILTSMHRFDEAIVALKAILKLKPKNKSYLLAYAELSLHIGKKKEADKAYRKLLKMGDNDKAYHQLILAYFESIGDDEAIRLLNENNESNDKYNENNNKEK